MKTRRHRAGLLDLYDPRTSLPVIPCGAGIPLGVLSFAIYAMQSPTYELAEPLIAKWTAAMNNAPATAPTRAPEKPLSSNKLLEQ